MDWIEKGEVLMVLKEMPLDINEVTTQTAYDTTLQDEEDCSDEGIVGDTLPEGKWFITSPTGIDIHRRVSLKDADVSMEDK